MLEDQLEKIRKLLKENLEVKISLMESGNSLQLKRQLQHFLEIKIEEKNLEPLFKMILNHALHAEQSCPGAGYIFLRKFCQTQILNEEFFGRKTKLDVFKTLKELNHSQRNFKILETILENSSRNTKISIKKSSNSSTYLEILEGHNFYLKHLFKIQSVILTDAKVCCLDGYIETVSEIHHLLTELSNSNVPCLLFCRGMSDDVLHTLKVNNDRKTLSIYPFVVPYDLDNVNTLVDIAVVSNTDVTSTTKGELISSIRFKNLGYVVKATLAQDNVVLISSSSFKESIRRHIKNLEITLNDRPEIEEILTKRLRNLHANNIIVSLPDGINYYSDSQQIDEGIRVIMSYMKDSYHPNDISNFFLEKMNNLLNGTECLLF